MKYLKQVGCALVAFGVLPLTELRAWDQVITFNEFDPGTYDDPEAPIAQRVRVVGDEGFEESAGAFARHHLADDGAGGLMYSLSTDGYGWSWGQVFAAIELDEPIVGEGTLYFQIALEGTGLSDLSLGLSHEIPQPADPGNTANPWGWRNMGDWSAYRTQTQVDHAGMIGIRHGGVFKDGAIPWVPGVWYHVWMTFDTKASLYSVFLLSPDGGIAEQTLLRVRDLSLGGYHEEYFFRGSADVLRSIYVGMTAGNPDGPNVDHRWWINNIAVDFESENLSDPPVSAPGPPPPVDPRIFGFPPVTDDEADAMRVIAAGMLGRDVWFGDAPYAYSFDLERWLFLPHLVWKDPHRTNLAALRGTWAYVWDNPFPEEEWHFAEAIETWVYGYEGGWTFVLNSRVL